MVVIIRWRVKLNYLRQFCVRQAERFLDEDVFASLQGGDDL